MNIMKKYSFCYAHRVWNQTLSTGVTCKCRYSHGHTSAVEMVLRSPALVKGMVIDFNELKFIKQFIDDVIDHHTLIDIEDPLTPHYLKMLNCSLDDLDTCFRYWKLNSSKLRSLSTELQEFGESLVFVNTVPTSEYLAVWISEIIQHKLSNHPLCVERHVRLASLKWWESDSSYAEWINPLEVLS